MSLVSERSADVSTAAADQQVYIIPVLLFEYMCWLKNRGPCKIAVRTYDIV
jgi:hypothetical protein